MRIGLKCLILSVILTCLLNVSVFASDNRGTSLGNMGTDISGGGAMSWETAKVHLEARLKYAKGFDRTSNLGWKEGNYLIYVCTTHGVSYEDYNEYATRFKEDYIQNGAAENVFFVVCDTTYAELLEARKKIIKEPEKNRVLIADSGFTVMKNGFRIRNFACTEFSKGGTCAGLADFSIMAYLNSDKLKSPLTFNTYKDKISSYAEGFNTYGYTVDFSNVISSNKNLYDYIPVTTALKDRVPEQIIKRGESISKSKLEEYMKIFRAPFNFSEVEGTIDGELVHGLSLLWGRLNSILIDERAEKSKANLITTSIYAPSSAKDLDLVISEFKAGRPVNVCFRKAEAGGHSVVGYKLERDVTDKNLYYMSIYDPNFPGNSYFASDFSPTIVIYVGTSYGNKALYFFYSPYSDIDAVDRTDYRFTEQLSFLDYQGRYLHHSDIYDTFGQELSSSAKGY